MTPRIANGPRDPAGAPARRAAGSLRVALGLVLVLLGACASTPDEPVTEPATQLVAGREVAADLGLSAQPVDGAGRRVLARGSDSRIVFYDGSSLISVRGSTLRAPAPVKFVDGDAWIDEGTASAILRAWSRTEPLNTSLGSALPPAPGATLPPPPGRGPSYRPTWPVPAAPPGSRPTVPSKTVPLGNRPSAAELRAWAVPLRRSWHYLVLHHSATAAGSAASFHEAHKRKRWNGLGYDFVIGNGNGAADGLVEVGYRWQEQTDGAHAGDKLMNQRGIGICLVGNFMTSRPTPRQMASLERLMTFLSSYCKIPSQNVRLHRDFRDTECPGTYFPRNLAVSLERRPDVRTGAGEAHEGCGCGAEARGGVDHDAGAVVSRRGASAPDEQSPGE